MSQINVSPTPKPEKITDQTYIRLQVMKFLCSSQYVEKKDWIGISVPASLYYKELVITKEVEIQL